jgi:hypothetical protein
VTMITQDCVQPVWLSDCRVGAITAGWVGSLLNRLTRGFSNCGSWPTRKSQTTLKVVTQFSRITENILACRPFPRQHPQNTHGQQ